MVSWLATYVSRKDKGKEQSFQAVVLGQSKHCHEKSEIGSCDNLFLCIILARLRAQLFNHILI